MPTKVNKPDIYTHYARLGVSQAVNASELHAAFVRHAYAAHSAQGGSEISFKQAVRALEVLVEPDARKKYDQLIGNIEQGGLVNRFYDCPSPARVGQHVVLKLPDSKSVRSVGKVESTMFFRRLHSLLRQLPQELRREAILHRLSGSQRRGLERWMLTQRSLTSRSAAPRFMRKASSNTFGSTVLGTRVRKDIFGAIAVGEKMSLSERSLCRHIVKGRSPGYRPTVHLAGGLYAYAAFTQDLKTAIRSLGCLVALRSFCRVAADVSNDQEPRMCAQSFEVRLRSALVEAFQWCPQPRPPALYFRVKLAAARNKQRTSPARRDPVLAIADWRRMQDDQKVPTLHDDDSSRTLRRNSARMQYMRRDTHCFCRSYLRHPGVAPLGGPSTFSKGIVLSQSCVMRGPCTREERLFRLMDQLLSTCRERKDFCKRPWRKTHPGGRGTSDDTCAKKIRNDSAEEFFRYPQAAGHEKLTAASSPA